MTICSHWNQRITEVLETQHLEPTPAAHAQILSLCYQSSTGPFSWPHPIPPRLVRFFRELTGNISPRCHTPKKRAGAGGWRLISTSQFVVSESRKLQPDRQRLSPELEGTPVQGNNLPRIWDPQRQRQGSSRQLLCSQHAPMSQD